MKSGYVLDFSDRTFEQFVRDAVGRGIYDGAYSFNGTSKAKHLRSFLEVEPNHVVGTLIAALVEYAGTRDSPPSAELLAACRGIAERLKQCAGILENIAADTGEATFAALTKEVRWSIQRNEPATGLDRLHTFFVDLMRTVCKGRGVPTTREEPAHSLLGKYLKQCKRVGHIESEMTERILKYALSTMESFNHVRNNQSMAHSNPILNHDEALLIFNHVIAVVNFIHALEKRNDRPATPPGESDGEPDAPF